MNDKSEDRLNSIELGTYLGYRVFIGISRDPENAAAPDDWGVNLYIPNPDGENTDIARVDTDHKGVHMDRFYLSEEHPDYQHDYSVQYTDPESALRFEFLQKEMWQHYVDRYREEHGLDNELRVSPNSQSG